MISRREALALPAALALPHVGFAADGDDPTRVFTGDKKPTDARLGAPKTLNDYFPFVVPKTKEAWEARRKQLREQLLVANGLWPLPERTPLNATVHGARDMGEYTIEKVFFASMPGHYVCGNLYRPKANDDKKDAKRPGVLFAHGHWAGGRFHDDGEAAAKKSVDSKGEPDMDRGRFFMQALPVTLAKLGFVVFQYDMVGYADSTAIPHREGFRDTEAELRLQSQMGLQTWNSLRALDFLAGLPDVDAKRLGMTGASGGGTQTFITAALDDRLSAAFPAVMVSTGMQGGCVCENCSLLRVGTGNVEIAAMFGPKPQAMSAANDWTKELMTKGLPELQQLYDLYGAKDKIAVRAWLEYGHQYNVHARQMMYSWFLKHLQDKTADITEPGFKPVPVKELSVFDDKHPRPKDELNAKALRAELTKASDEQIAKLIPKDAASLKAYRDVVGTALRAMVNCTPIPKASHQFAFTFYAYKDGPPGVRALFGRKVKDTTDSVDPFKPGTTHEAIPCFLARSRKPNREDSVVWVHPKGKASLFDGAKLVPAAQALTEAGYNVFAFDAFLTGEQVREKSVPVDKGYAGYTYGYNRSLLAQRVCDTLVAIAMTFHQACWSMQNAKLHLVGWEEFGPIAVLARALTTELDMRAVVGKTAADLNQFDFAKITDTADPFMLPGAVKYGGMGAFLALCAPGEVLVHNHRGTETGRASRAAYEAAGAANKLTRSPDKLEPAKVVEWLLK
jgi:hypothetical protein